VNGLWRSLRSATEGDENGGGKRDITSMPRVIEAECGLAMQRPFVNVARNALGEQNSEAPAARWEAR
jgi:hypothetical protein